jgi:hypothetical protein
MLITKLLNVVTLSFVIIVLILLNIYRQTHGKKTLTSAYLSTRTDILKYCGHFVFSL